MNLERTLAVLVVADHEDARALYVETLTAVGCAVDATESLDEIIGRATASSVDVVVLDIGLHAAAFAIAEGLAPLRNRPRLIAVTDVAPTGTALERLFDGFIVEPCVPDDLIEAVDSVMSVKVLDQDLLIVVRDGKGAPEALRHFGDIGARVEVRVDQRHGERRCRAHRATHEERRRRDRRMRDVSNRLRIAGWALVPGSQRS